MFALTVNGKTVELDVSEDMPLLWVLRDIMGLTGTKYGCGNGVCGSCTVYMDGKAVQACNVPVGSIKNKEILTIEGVLDDPVTQKLLVAWKKTEPTQCGYCQPGQIMAAMALLKNNANPDKDEIKQAMSGHLCRCGTYQRVYQAIKIVVGLMDDE